MDTDIGKQVLKHLHVEVTRKSRLSVYQKVLKSRLLHGNLIQKYNAAYSTMQGQLFHIYIEDNQFAYFFLPY